MLEYSYNNKSIAYRLSGGGGKRILLLHDIGGSGEDFQSLAEKFSSRATLIVPDLCGHGESYLPQQMVSLKTMAREIIALLRARYIGRVDVVAAGSAGAVALEAFSMQQELFGDFVFLDTFICPEARRVFAEGLRPVEEERYTGFRNTFKRWVPAYREDFFIFCNEFDGRGLCRLSSSRFLFVYGDRGRDVEINPFAYAASGVLQYSAMYYCRRGRWLLQKNVAALVVFLRDFYLIPSPGPEGEETADSPDTPPDIGDLLLFY